MEQFCKKKLVGGWRAGIWVGEGVGTFHSLNFGRDPRKKWAVKPIYRNSSLREISVFHLNFLEQFQVSKKNSIFELMIYGSTLRDLGNTCKVCINLEKPMKHLGKV